MRRHRQRVDDDGGFALPFVLLVTMMVCVGVATTLSVTTPGITRARDDANAQRAAAAARAAIDDAEAWLEGDTVCRSTTRICAKAFDTDSRNLVRPALSALGASVYWKIDHTATTDGYLRVRASSTVDRSTRTAVADLALAPSILSFGYYSDYESQSPAALMESSPTRSIYFDNSNYTQYISAVTTANKSTTVSAPLSAGWDGVTTNDTAICGQHWWNDGTTKGRGSTYTTPGATAYTESATLSTSGMKALTRAGGCDVVFTTGQTFDGPIYTRDAIYISNGSGNGPLFKAAVKTGWGYADHVVPKPASASKPWLGDSPASGSQTPSLATFDLQLPTDIGTEGVAANACVYSGPTRVVLNSDGTSTVTSPRTTGKNAASDPACYPGVVPATGLSRFVVPATAGGGTLLARTIGTAPAAGTAWPVTGTKSTIAATSANSVFFQRASGATTPDQSNTSAASAWTGKWTKSPAGTTCANAATDGTDQKKFECEAGVTFAVFQTQVQNALTAGTCATATPANQPGCVTALVNGLLPKPSGVTYLATAAASTSPAGTTKSFGATPTAPQASDALFVNTAGTASQESSTLTAVPLTVTRQVGSGTKVSQFTFTATQTAWAVTTTGTATSYFPNTADVTPYAASTGTNAPGDLYVDGTNHGKHSLLADNDVVVTNNVVDASSDTDVDALNLVAGGDIRNYNPVSCLSTAATASIANTAAGFCPNDLTGLSTSSNGQVGNGTLTQYNPAKQYVNINSPADREVDAALFALTGSLRSDNYNRGVKMGNLLVKGGLYQSHRGANGQNVATSGAVVQLGYFLNYQYVDLRKAALPYEPTTRTKTGRVWRVVSITGGTS